MERKITALEPQKRNPQRLNVYLDGEFALGLSQSTAAGLKIGQVIDEAKIRELQTAEERETAYQKALHYLSYRPRSENEVRGNLKKHDLSDEVILEVIERLKHNHLVNDTDFAQVWIENRSAFRPRSRRALKAELRQKGIADDMIEEALLDLDEEQFAYQAALQQSRKYEKLEWQEFRQKMGAFLARRGFDFEIAREIILRVWAETRATRDIKELF